MKINVDLNRLPLVTKNSRHEGVKLIPAETYAMAMAYVIIEPENHQSDEDFEREYQLCSELLNAIKYALEYNGLVEHQPDLKLDRVWLKRKRMTDRLTKEILNEQTKS